MKPLNHGIFGVEGTESFPFFGSQKKHTAWVEQSFSTSHHDGKRTPVATGRQHVGSSVSLHVIRRFAVFMVCILIFLIVRLVQLQLIQGTNYLALAEGNRQRNIPIPSERGLIFDRSGIQLTKNIPKLSLVLIPQELPRETLAREEIIRDLSRITQKDTKAIRDLLREYGSYSYESIILEENIPYEQALAIEIAAADLPGIGIEQGSKRLYLQNVEEQLSSGSSSSLHSLSHILGYAGKLDKSELEMMRPQGYLTTDSIGKTGVEKSYESLLRGTYGVSRKEVDVKEREQKIIAEVAPVPGKHVYLTIDLAMQQELEKVLQDALTESKKTRGAAIAMDPRNGAIRAMVSLPSFDNNDFSGGIDEKTYAAYIQNPDRPLFQRAIAGTYPSGSTVKPVIAAAALQEKIITPQTTFLSVGGLSVGQWFFPDWLPGGHGITNVTKSIAWSVNTFYYYIGGGHQTFVGLGVDKITYYLHKFGFGEKLGIDIPGESAGFLPSKDWKEQTKGERWYIGDTYNLSIGQGDLLVTPLQIANMTAAVANRGTVYQPRIIEKKEDAQTKVVEQVEPIILNEKIIDTQHLDIVRKGMRDCVISASCRRLASLPVAVSGKTGTAQWSTLHDPHAWFTSFAPHDNPEIVLTILIEEGKEGSSVAVPVAEKFYQWWTLRSRVN